MIPNNLNPRFTLKFDFVPELSDKHSIDIEIYQKSLKGIETVIRRANKLTNGTEENLRIDILANDEGSFIVELILFYLNNQLIEPTNILYLLGFSGNLVQNTSNVCSMLSLPISLLSLFKQTRGKRIVKEEVINTDTISIVIEGGEIIDVNKEVVKYYKDPEIREGIENTTKCLENPDLSNIQFYDPYENYEPIIIKKEELSYYASHESDKKLLNTESNLHMKLEVIHADFGEASDKWRFRDVKTKVEFDAKLADQNYVDKVNQGIALFNSGMILEVDMDVSTYEYARSNISRYKRVIMKVHDMSPEEKHNLSKPNKEIQTLDGFI